MAVSFYDKLLRQLQGWRYAPYAALFHVDLHNTSSVSAEQRQQLQGVLVRCAQETRANDALLEARWARARRTLQTL